MDRKLLKDGEFCPDNSIVWHPDLIITDDVQDILVPLSLWLSHKEDIRPLSLRKLLYILPDDELTETEADLSEFNGIAIEFPGFLDGRGYSHARTLRDHLNYRGEIRAVGDVLVDQLFFMKRCGFSSFVLKPGQNPDAAVKALNTFQFSYQQGSDSQMPLHHIRKCL
ncbi:DUF934 domain-containing protein [Endozoicomonas gorgoniicola]|uniref:DUF934 domain-containing protein n=1 Tax=Endozoicomonas gorgoniicola TaxID=1234144 RepID=A0ABT3MT33_9GAMM|nr:DUF934 domain-containing protein [Endozoicomonas gorgoniicola]MCW7552541.1 DUF934 domain-containing protein [Endozoicomonas gorgoniicola]